MSDRDDLAVGVGEALVERGAQGLFAHLHRRAEWETAVEEYKSLVRLDAKSVLAAVLPDVRRAVAEEIATAIEAERADVTRLDLKQPDGVAAFGRARTLNEAAFIARHTGGAPLGKRYDEPAAVQEMFDTLARIRQRHGQATETPPSSPSGSATREASDG